MQNILLILLLLAGLAAPSGAQAQAVILKTDTISLPCALTDTFRVPVRVESFTNVGSFQFTLSWNNTYLDYQGVSKGLATNPFYLNGANASFDTTSFVNGGKLTFAWNKVGGATFPDGSVVFYVVFRRLGGPFTPVQFVTTPVGIEVTDPLGEDLPWKTQPGGVRPIDNQAPTITCPLNMNQLVSSPTPVNGISPTSVADNCTLQSVGWVSTGSTMASFPVDPDASGAVFGFGLSTVTYTATDVGGQTATCSFTINLAPSIASGTLAVLLENSPASCGQSVALDVTTFNFDSIGSLQFSVNWNTTLLKFDSISINGTVLILSNSNFGVSLANSGRLSFAWTTNSLAGTTAADGSLLFRIYFTAISSGIASVQFGDDPTSREAFTSTVEEISAFYVPGQVMVTDNVPPTLVCPANIPVQTQPGNLTADITGTAPTTLTDLCSAVTTLAYAATGTTPGTGTGNADRTYNAGTTTVTYTATDGSGNSATCSFTINVDAGISAKLSLEAVAADCQTAGQQVTMNFTVADFANVLGLQFVINWDTAQLKLANGVTNVYPGLDLNPGNFQNYQDTVAGTLRFLAGSAGGDWPDIPNGGTFFTLVFNVVDADPAAVVQFLGPLDAVNNQFFSVPVDTSNGSVSAIIDASGPVFTACPADTTIVPPIGVCQVELDFLVEATDACSGVSSILTNQNDNLFDTGNTTVIYTATDVVGNSSQCSFQVAIIADNIPAIVCPANITMSAGAADCSAVATWTDPVVTGVCDFTNIEQETNYLPGDTFVLGSTTVTYILRNLISGAETTCSFSVTVADTTRPVIACPANVLVPIGSVVNCQAVVNFPVATANDNCDQNLELAGDHQPGASFGAGTTTVTYLAVDDFNNTASCTFDIVVPDLTPPTLICPDDITVSVAPNACDAVVTWPSPQPTDDCDPGQIPPVSDRLSGETFLASTTIVNYMATDNSGNEASCSFSVTVVEDEAPVLTPCPADILVQLPVDQCDTTLTWIAPTATDNCSQPTIEPAQSSNLFPTGVTIVTYTATDDAQNTATCTFRVTVIDQVAPIFGPCPSAATVNTTDPCGVLYTWAIPPATDNCTSNADLEYFTSKMPTDSFPIGITTVIMEVIDASGNRDSCSFKVTVNSTVIPQFILVPDTITLNTLGCTAVATWNPPIVEGFCTAPVITSSFEPGDTFPVGATTVKYIATNEIGVETMATFVVVVQESVPPLITCPTADMVVSVTGGIISDPSGFLISADTANACTGVVLLFDDPSATDNCSSALVLPVSGPSSGEVFPAGTTTLIFKASDISANESTCSFNIVVQPLAALVPVVSANPGCPGQEVTLTVTNIPGATYTWTGPQQSYPNSPIITLISLDEGNTGTYSVVGSLNGCTTPPGFAAVLMVVKPDAREDLDFVMDPGTTGTFDVLLNDTLFLTGDIVVTQLSQLAGLTYAGDGKFAYTAGAAPGLVSFIYQICSRACPDDQFCDMATVTIRIRDIKCSFIPNVFTPNGDNVNDWLVIDCLDGGGFPENSIVIYNQWGGKIYEAAPYDNDQAKAWRGTLDGEPGKDLPDGAYYYVFRAGPNEPVIKGFIEIYR